MKVSVLKCPSCGRFQSPPAFFCRLCGASGLEKTCVDGEGTIYSYSTVYVPLSALEDKAPYTIVIVELKVGCKVTGRIVVEDPSKLSIGTSVKLVDIKDGVYFFDFAD
ncbi:MAG: hypothetical protein KatS3mg078_0591 [Deltaproteobacteria bacterium]|jgi:uncharacterized OB-fold protein|nr:hypothetical protein HRbin37_00352 [bacterium HR37]GIW46714.1 MAG: hypothetical protein KatS3mg078_0591 [Deltaproteobacteria bacterium]